MTEPLANEIDLEDFQESDAAQMLAAADAYVRRYCGWHIYPSVTETIAVDGKNSYLQPLPTLRLTDVEEVVNDGDTLPIEDVRWSVSGYLEWDGWFTWKPRGVVVTMTHGYETVPGDLQAVVLGIASRLAEQPGSNVVDHKMGPFEEKFVVNKDGSVGGLTLNSLEREILSRYKLMGIA